MVVNPPGVSHRQSRVRSPQKKMLLEFFPSFDSFGVETIAAGEAEKKKKIDLLVGWAAHGAHWCRPNKQQQLGDLVIESLNILYVEYSKPAIRRCVPIVGRRGTSNLNRVIHTRRLHK